MDKSFYTEVLNREMVSVNEITKKRDWNSKTFSLDEPNKFQFVGQAGMHYLNNQKSFQAVEVAGNTEDFLAGRFSDKVMKSRLPLRFSKNDGRLRLYPVWGDNSQWVEILEPAVAKLSLTRDANGFSATSAPVDINFIATPEGFSFIFTIKNDQITSRDFEVAANQISPRIVNNILYLEDTDGVTQAQISGSVQDSSDPEKGAVVNLSLSGSLTISYDKTGLVFPVTLALRVEAWVPKIESLGTSTVSD